MKIVEILNTKVEIKVVKTSPTYEAKATIGNRTIVFSAEWRSLIQQWHVNFHELKNNTVSSKLTGSGNEFEVFSMVKESINHFIETINPEIFYFTAENDYAEGERNTRANLYSKLASKFRHPNYEYDEEYDEDSLAYGEDTIRFTFRVK